MSEKEISGENLQGIVKTYYDNGNPKTIVTYDDKGNANGPSIFFYENGERKSIVLYKDNNLTGYTISFNEDGTLKGFQNYKYGSKDGYGVKFAKDGSYTEGFYHNGVVTDYADYYREYLMGGKPNSEVTYYDNGQIKWKGEYFKDALFGTSIYYYENGRMQHLALYFGDKPNGPKISFYENGKIKSIAFYNEDNKRDGFLLKYSEDGRNVEELYNDGKCIGTLEEYEGRRVEPSDVAEFKYQKECENNITRSEYNMSNNVKENILALFKSDEVNNTVLRMIALDSTLWGDERATFLNNPEDYQAKYPDNYKKVQKVIEKNPDYRKRLSRIMKDVKTEMDANKEVNTLVLQQRSGRQ